MWLECILFGQMTFSVPNVIYMWLISLVYVAKTSNYVVQIFLYDQDLFLFGHDIYVVIMTC